MPVKTVRTTHMAGILCAAALSPAWADDVPEGWSGDAGLGFAVTTGNTETETINAKATLVHKREPWKLAGKLDVLKGSDSGETNADRVTAEAKADLSLGESSYVFGLLNYEDDRFSGYDYRVSESAGYGHRLLNTDEYTLNAEFGAGARQSRLSGTEEDENDTILRLAGLFEWRISEVATFSEELDSESGGGLSVTRSLSTLTTQVAGNLAAKFSYRVSHDSDVPPGIEKTGSETTITLMYKF